MIKISEQEKQRLIYFLTPRISNIDSNSLYCEDDEEICEIQDLVEANQINFGCTKLVLFYNDFPDLVIKIPFKGVKNYDDYEDEYYYEDFDTDYCALESSNYSKSFSSGINDMFAATYFLANINNIPVYVSEKITCDVILKPSNALKTATTLINKSDFLVNDSRLNPTTVSVFIKDYGLKKVLKLLKFLEENNINDLHGGNVGFNSNNSICFIDYSGFFE